MIKWDSGKIRRFFATNGLILREWDKMRTDMLTIQDSTEPFIANANTTAIAH